MLSDSLVLVVSSLTILAIVSSESTHSRVNLNAAYDRSPLSDDQMINFETIGGIPGDDSLSICRKNALLLNETLGSLQSGDILLIPFNRTFWLMGDIYARGLSHVTIQIDGILKFSDNILEWPRDPQTLHVRECFYFEQLDHVTFTSSQSGINKGIIDGSGHLWWGVVQYVVIRGNRPLLLSIYNSTNLLIENLLLKNPPKYAFNAKDVANLEIRYTDIDAHIHPDVQWHDLDELTAFNTDGFDVSGTNVWIHDCNIWNDDDCIAVKEQNSNSIHSSCSENMLFERINASGVGLTIGSVGGSAAHNCVRNITFRNCTMYNTFKGIYLKSRPGGNGDTAEISDVLYENIQIHNASQWSIWIGPQQAAFKDACSLLWPFIPEAPCPIPSGVTWNNIVLRNITLSNPQLSPGVIIGNSSNPMQNVLFDNVIVKNPGSHPWGDKYYACSGVEGIAQGDTNPPPPCFKHQPL
jgi:polygalacturonase